MPRLKKLSVNVVTKNGNLPALGIETNRRNTLCESYISSSQTDTDFWVSIKPDKDFFPAVPTTGSTRSGYTNLTRDYISYRGKRPQEWHLLVKVFLDDLEDAETTAIVYLPWNGKVRERIIHGRIACTADGHSIEKSWRFKEIGLESSVKHLSVEDADAEGNYAVTGTETPRGALEDVLLEKMGSLGTIIEGEKASTVGKIGQIRVILQKIVITGCSKEKDYRPDLADTEQREPCNTGRLSHLAQAGRPIEIKFRETRQRYREVEPGFYATFVFNYRSDAQLQKMRLLEKVGSSGRKLENLVPYMTPLTFNGRRKTAKSPMEPEVRSSVSEPIFTLDTPRNDRNMEDSLMELEAPSDKELPIRGQSIASSINCDSEKSDDDDCEPILCPSEPLTVAGIEHQKEVAFIVSTTKNISISSPQESQVLGLCVSPASDPGQNWDSETNTHSPLAIMDSEDKSTTQLIKVKADGFVTELTQKLQVTKRCYSSEDEGNSRESDEDGAQSERQIKRIKYHEENRSLVILGPETI